GEEQNTNKLSRRERNCACGQFLAWILIERASSRSSPSARSCLPHRSNRRENDLQVTVSPVFSLSRCLLAAGQKEKRLLAKGSLSRLGGAAWLSSARVVRYLVKSYNERNPYFVLLRHAPKEKVFAAEVSRGAEERLGIQASRPVVWYVVRLVRPTKMALKQTKRCVPHLRRTASDILEERGDDVKFAWPLWAGPHTCYNGNYNGKQGLIADQHAAVNMYPGPVHTARHTLGIGFSRIIKPMITHDFCVPLVPQSLLVVLLAHTTAGSSTGRAGEGSKGQVARGESENPRIPFSFLFINQKSRQTGHY
nr:ribosomal protein S10 [Tanacetum cinerariifolium]